MPRPSHIFLWMSIVAACGGPAVRPEDATRGTGGTREDALRLCHDDGGPNRNDYSTIASWRCADGSMPLGGDPERGAAARRGNVGPGDDGHIVDLYEVPCPGGTVEVYVDAYHCAGQDTEVDPRSLRREQLQRMAQSIRELNTDPTSERAMEQRAQLLVWVLNTEQFTAVLCEGLVPILPDANHEIPFIAELTLSLAASVIEDGRDPADPVLANVNAIQGLLVYYDAVLRERGQIAAEPHMDALRAMAAEGTLEARVRELSSTCNFARLGVHFYRGER
ncbi:MAG: hypothetical protein K8H88_28670 [Sandaracinaceae bacterium]|nr:hypothetical protein [Sandaracinaceae bacterium]